MQTVTESKPSAIDYNDGAIKRRIRKDLVRLAKYPVIGHGFQSFIADACMGHVQENDKAGKPRSVMVCGNREEFQAAAIAALSPQLDSLYAEFAEFAAGQKGNLFPGDEFEEHAQPEESVALQSAFRRLIKRQGGSRSVSMKRLVETYNVKK